MIFCLTFDLCRFTFAFYNWTATQAHSGSLQTSNVKPEVKRDGCPKLLPISDKVSTVIQGVLVQHFRFF